MRRHAFLMLLSALTLLNCSSDPATGTPGTGGSGGTPSTNPLAPPAADDGVQYKMVTTIAAGQEIERCQLFVAPKEGLFVRKDEVRISVLPQTQSWIAAQNKSMRDDNFVNFGGMEMVSVMLP